jgi:acetyl-CoA carboxylase carboxyl transferase subunit alpha
MKVTSYDLLKMGIADQIIKEPKGGAHSDVEGAAQIVKDVIIDVTQELKDIPIGILLEERYNKYKNIGDWDTVG